MTSSVATGTQSRYVRAVTGGSLFRNGSFHAENLTIRQDRIESIWSGSGSSGARRAQAPDDGITIDASGFYVIPGLVDIHFHGCVGHDVSDGTEVGIHAIAAFEARQGITSICPATMTLPHDELCAALQCMAAFRPSSDEARLVGINVEGPFISPHNLGAQNPAYVRKASQEEYETLQHAAHGLIRILDLAPEELSDPELIRRSAQTCRISLAHTSCTYEEAAAAFSAGARHLTHLFNAMPPLHHRAPGPIAAACERDDVCAELICDGIHVHPAMVRLAFKLFGPERICLISDSLRACGLGEGIFDLAGQSFNVKGARATLADGTIAGSVTTLAGCVRHAHENCGITLVDAIKAATETPARAIGCFDDIGSLDSGKQADIVLLSPELDTVHVILRGRFLF